MQNANEYQNFDENDFLCDPYFQEWVINANEETDLFWTAFFEANPDKRKAGETARKLLTSIHFTEEFPEADLMERSFEQHLAEIEGGNEKKVISIRKRFFQSRLLRIAAVFAGVLLMLSVVLLFNKDDKPLLVKTGFGNIKSLILPDSSVVVMNGNSTIKFSKDWNKSSSREVWLEGEAFFDVRHLNQDSTQIEKYQQFIVHTAGLTVHVLGTSFDIRQRREKTEVVLQTGSIRVSFAQGKRGEVVMKPGEKLLYHADEDKLVTGTTNAESFSAWKEKRLLLDDPSVAEVITYLEDVYGKDIILQNPELGKRRIEGPIQLTNLDDALFVLSTVLDAAVIKKDSSIIIRSR